MLTYGIIPRAKQNRCISPPNILAVSEFMKSFDSPLEEGRD